MSLLSMQAVLLILLQPIVNCLLVMHTLVRSISVLVSGE